MRRAIVLGFCAFGLAGCYSDQAQQVAACSLETEKFLATHLKDANVDEQLLRGSNMTTLCMEAHGYAMDLNLRCQEAWQIDDKQSVTVNAMVFNGRANTGFCYTPLNWTERQFSDLERWWYGR